MVDGNLSRRRPLSQEIGIAVVKQRNELKSRVEVAVVDA